MADGGRSESARARRVVVTQGDVCWASLPTPIGSGPGFRRPVVVVQGDAFNASKLATVIVVPLTSNLRWAAAPGNVLLSARLTGLPKDSVANVSQLVAVGRNVLSETTGRLDERHLALILTGIDVVLGRDSV
jgi:mRNA interferase MazF